MTQDTGSGPGGTLIDDPGAPDPARRIPPSPAPEPAKTGGSIFISYASGDLAAAREIRRHLEDGGYTCWMAPDSVRGPKPWAEQIVDAIHDCQAMIVLMSSHSNASTHVSKELQLASEQAKPLLPVRVEDMNPSGSMEYLLALAQWVDAFPGPIADHAAVLREGVAAIFAAAGVPAPASEAVPPSAPARICSSCGTPAGSAERFCSQCGQGLESQAPSPTTKPPEAAPPPATEPNALLSILTGRKGRGPQLGSLAGALVVIAAIVVGIMALGGDDASTEEVAATTPVTEAQASTTTSPTSPVTTAATTPVTTAPVVTPVSIVPTDVGPDTFVDQFDGVLEPGWSWMSEVPTNWSLTATPGVLRIRATDVFPAENVLVRPVPAASFEATTVVSFTPSENYQVAGLTVVDNPTDFVQLGRGFCDHCVGDGIYFDLVLDGVLVGDSLMAAIEPTEHLHLRIDSDGESFTGFYSTDGRSWTAVGTHQVVFASPQVGVAAHQSPIPAAAEFEFFTVTPLGEQIPGPHMVSVFDLQEGDCFDDPADLSSSLGEVPVIDCGLPHDNEIYAVFDYVGGDTFPGPSAIEAYVEAECIDRFEAFVGIGYFDSEIWYSALWPTEGSWEAGDREIVCFLYEGDLSKITGSLQGAAR